MKKVAMGFLALGLLVTGCSAGASNKDAESINTIKDGVIYYYSKDDPTAKDKLKSIQEVADTFATEVVPVDVSSEKGKADIEKYKKDNKEAIDNYTVVRDLEGKIFTDKLKEEDYRKYNQAYKRALDQVKDKERTAEDDAKLTGYKKTLAEVITPEEVGTLLSLQTAPRLFSPYYNEKDGEADKAQLPIMKVVFEGNVRKSVTLAESTLPDGVKNASGLKDYLRSDGWIGNFQNSNQGDELRKKIENKESFITFFYGNACPHCMRLEPVLEKLSKETGVQYFSVDLWLDENINQVSDIIEEGSSGLQPIKTVPTLVVFKDGKVTEVHNSYDWTTDDTSDSMGYTINEGFLKEFLTNNK